MLPESGDLIALRMDSLTPDCSFCRALVLRSWAFDCLVLMAEEEDPGVGLLLLLYSLAICFLGKNSFDRKACTLVDLFAEFCYEMSIFPVGLISMKGLKKGIVSIHGVHCVCNM